MTKLDCTVYGCTYNADNSCTRGKIHVGGHEAIKSSETVCRSFEPKGSKGEKNSVSNSTASAERPTDISCDAVKCIYNKEKKCHAEHIRVAGVHAVASGETECGSFVAK